MSITPSTISTLSDRVAKRNYQKYLVELSLKRIRSFTDQKVRFDFPVTAIIGTNGGGKSTILGAAALAYKDIRPRDFFPKSNVSDTSMSDWEVQYDILDRTAASNATTDARFVDKRWRRNNSLDRKVLFFPIQRTVPAGENGRFRKFIGSNQLNDVFTQDLSDNVISCATRVLGRDISKYKKAFLKSGDPDYILVGVSKSKEYSQFHFGAGEASIIDIILTIEESEKESLILIEEIENGLHPVAIKMLIEYLVDVAGRKRQQIIYTTHSSYALEGLPSQAVWACVDGEVRQGVLSIESLRAMIGDVRKDKVIFTEDQFALEWIEDALRQYAGKRFHEFEIHAAGGFPFNVETARHHNNNPTTTSKAFALVDGDQSLAGSNSGFVFSLPGGIPESEVYNHVYQNIDSLSSKLRQRCNVEYLSADELKTFVSDVYLQNKDAHNLFIELSEKLDFVSDIVIRKAFISLYNSGNVEYMRTLVESLLVSQ